MNSHKRSLIQKDKMAGCAQHLLVLPETVRSDFSDRNSATGSDVKLEFDKGCQISAKKDLKNFPR
jgi:Pyruvate/2-oxoacid:ferredoxin oxidoreductase delta subunit